MQARQDSMSNLQLELLKLYSRDVSEQDLVAIRYLIGLYFAEKTTAAMDEFIEKNNVKPEEIAKWAYEHWRGKHRS
jgi:hypothetical protein